MTDDLSEQAIRDRAYQLWLEAGSPDGQDTTFWQEARDQLAASTVPSETETDGNVAEGAFDEDVPEAIPLESK